MVVKVKKWQRKLVEIAHEYTVSYNPYDRTKHIIRIKMIFHTGNNYTMTN